MTCPWCGNETGAPFLAGHHCARLDKRRVKLDARSKHNPERVAKDLAAIRAAVIRAREDWPVCDRCHRHYNDADCGCP